MAAMHAARPRPARFRRLIARLSALALVLVLAGCYLPVRYDAEIDVNRAGYYEFFFDGYLAKVQLYQGLQDGEIDAAQEREEIEVIRTDFERDSGTTAFEYFKQGHFRVQYQRSGDLLKTRTFTFFRRNELFFNLAYNAETGQITMMGRSMNRENKDRIRAMGLDSSGELRLFTDGKVVSHNATTVRPFPSKGPNYMLYTWKIANLLAPTPVLKIQIR